ncbi:MAG: hypothetical protein JWN85_1164 [Gammaproteobacteria bacterium]|jgi:hypothetical protein|nr:hypothetical protein [Gammaproteobacteria bacterium]
MEYLIGVVLTFVVLLGATLIGLDRDRAFYPVVAMVSASYYGLFAIVGDSGETLLWELIPIFLFLLTAVLGFKNSLWWIVLVLAAHGVFDLFHAALIHNPGVPLWWPMFCLTFDLVAAAYLAWLLVSARVTAAPVVQFKH